MSYLLSLPALCGLIILAAVYPTAQASPDADGYADWYTIEMVIFARDAASTEDWPQTLSLKYPDAVDRLVDPAVQNDTDNVDPTATGPDLSSAVAAEPANLPGTDDGTASAMLEAQGQGEIAATAAGPTAHQLLPLEAGLLSAQAAALAKAPGHRLLRHLRWQQPLTGRQTATPVLIQGGEQYDDHYQLEGTIKLAVERYLHLNTDLWLSEFVPADGDDSNPWPLLPKPPQPRQASDSATADPLRSNAAAQSFWFFDNPFQQWASNEFAVARTVTMRQDRRMRSNEIHYLDHPLMGILVTVTPYQPESPAE